MLRLLGDQQNIDKILSILEAEFEGKLLIKLDNLQNVVLIPPEKHHFNNKYFKAIPFTKRQKRIYDLMKEIIDDKKVSFAFVLSDDDSNNALFGGWQSYQNYDVKLKCNTIVVSDALKFQELTEGTFSATGYILHEIYETYLDQIKGISDYLKAHNKASQMQSELDGILISPTGGHIVNEENSGFTYHMITNSSNERYTYKTTIESMNIVKIDKFDGWIGPKKQGGEDEIIAPKVG